MSQREALKTFGIILPAVAEMMDEQKLSTDEAIAALWRFLGDAEQPKSVLEAIQRLEAAEDELELRFMLGQECIRALGLKHSRR